MIHAEDCTVMSPMDTDIPDHPSQTLFSIPAPNERPSFYTTAIVKHYLAHKIHKLMSLGAFRPSFTDYNAILSVHAEVIHALGNLPPTMRPEKPDTSWDLQYPEIMKHRLQISIIGNSFLLAMHKPYAARQAQSLELAVSAAIQVLDATQALFEKTRPHQYKIYTLVFYTIDAGLIISAMLAKYALRIGKKAAEHAIASLHQAVARLAVLKVSVSAAMSGEKVLCQCLERLERQRGSIASNPSQATVTTVSAAGQDITATAQSELETETTPTRPPGEMDGGEGGVVVPIDPIFSFDQWGNAGSDLFTQILDDEAWTASWLQQMDSISSMNFEFEDDAFEWDSSMPTASTM